ncbi:sugar transferase, partial [Candidatus Parcubacteria bacterium]|nr:sugar transferase [Candidatus Parcubacteria bacterium]
LVLGDMALAFFALFLTLLVRYFGNFSPSILNAHLIPFAIIYLVWLLCFYIFGLFDLSGMRQASELLRKTLKTLAVCFGLALAFFYLIPFFGITPKRNLLIDLLIFGALIFFWRRLFCFLFSSLYLQKIAFIGKTETALALEKDLSENPQFGYRSIGFLESNETADNLKEKLCKENIKTIILSQDTSNDNALTDKLYQLLSLKITFWQIDKAFEKILQKVPLQTLQQEWFLKNLAALNKEGYDKIKRVFDFIMALILLVLTSPFWLLTSITIKIEDGGHVFYKQKRVGKDNKPFVMWKFRSMIEKAEQNGAKWAEDKDERRTKVGKVIRRLHIDEFPQMLNVLKGDISTTGPRPERPEFVSELEKTIPHYKLRHLIKPGFTGWAQTRWIKYARTNADSFEKFQYDLYYLKNRSFALDLSILLRTFQLFLKKG